HTAAGKRMDNNRFASLHPGNMDARHHSDWGSYVCSVKIRHVPCQLLGWKRRQESPVCIQLASGPAELGSIRAIPGNNLIEGAEQVTQACRDLNIIETQKIKSGAGDRPYLVHKLDERDYRAGNPDFRVIRVKPLHHGKTCDAIADSARSNEQSPHRALELLNADRDLHGSARGPLARHAIARLIVQRSLHHRDAGHCIRRNGELCIQSECPSKYIECLVANLYLLGRWIVYS